MANIVDILSANYGASEATVQSVVTWLDAQGFSQSENLLPIGCEVCGVGAERITEVLSTARSLTVAGFPDGDGGNLVVRLVNSDTLVLTHSVPECAGDATAFGTWGSYHRHSIDENCICEWGQ